MTIRESDGLLELQCDAGDLRVKAGHEHLVTDGEPDPDHLELVHIDDAVVLDPSEFPTYDKAVLREALRGIASQEHGWFSVPSGLPDGIADLCPQHVQWADVMSDLFPVADDQVPIHPPGWTPQSWLT